MEKNQITFTLNLTSDIISAIADNVAKQLQNPETIQIKKEVQQIYTVKEVAKIVCKTESTVGRHIRLGLLN